MAISRIKTDGIQDDAVTQPKVSDNITLDGTEFVRVPAGTTAQRPSSAAGGQLRFNTDIGTLEQYNTVTNAWQAIDSPPIITAVTLSGSLSAADLAGGETVTITGSNFKTGATVTIGTTAASSVTINSTTQITITLPAKTAGDYDVKVTNTNGLAATSTNAISYNGVPAFSTAAGNVGSIPNAAAMSTITIVAAEPDSGTLAYSVTSGALPTGVSLGSANGQITGTPTGVTSDTTFNFTVTATDDENQTSSRAFNLIVLRQVFNYSIPFSSMWRNGNGQYLEFTPPSGASAGRLKWTTSLWIKKSRQETRVQLFSAHNASSGAQEDIRINSADAIRWYSHNSNGSAADSDLRTKAKLRSTTDWYHIVCVKDATLADQTARHKIYINGELQAFDASYIDYPTQNYESYIGNGQGSLRFQVGAVQNGQHFAGYMAEFHHVSGAALLPTSFGTNYRGAWIPKQYDTNDAAYGSNGFYLNFADNSAYGNDVSGNNNDLTATNFVTASRKTDTPTKNFTVLDDNRNANGCSLYDGNLASSKSAARYFAMAGTTMSAKDGTAGSRKWYFEVNCATYSSGGMAIGHAPSSEHQNPDVDSDLQVMGGWRARAFANATSTVIVQGQSQANFDVTGTQFADGDWVGVGLDFDNNEFKIWKADGTLVNTTDISSRVNFAEQWAPAAGNESGSQTKTITWNFGESGWNITGGIPTGYKGWNDFEKNEPANTPLDNTQPAKQFNTLLYTGNNTDNRAVTGLGFQPDLVWIKKRNGNMSHLIVDSVRDISDTGGGNGNVGISLHSATAAETNSSDGGFESFDSDGFTLGKGSSTANASAPYQRMNANSDTYVAWCWKAGGAPSTTNANGASAVPTAGSVKIDGANATGAASGSTITRRASANTKAGFSIVEYVGTGASPRTVNHWLGSAPSFIMIRNLDYSESWSAYHYRSKAITGGDGIVYIHATNSASNSTSFFNGTDPTDTVFTVNSHGSVNRDGNKHIAYCWTDVPGMQTFGHYQGNGSNNGPMIPTGFRPALVFFKNLSTGAWIVQDNKRQTINAANESNTAAVAWNSSQNENNGGDFGNANENSIDFLGHGFRIRDTNAYCNTDNNNYIWGAWAEVPAIYSVAE